MSSTVSTTNVMTGGTDLVGEPPAWLAEHHPAMTSERARAVALALLERADRVERAPRRAGGPRRYLGRLVVSRAVHDGALCGWRIATRDDHRPELAWCAGCGLAVEIGAPTGAGA